MSSVPARWCPGVAISSLCVALAGHDGDRSLHAHIPVERTLIFVSPWTVEGEGKAETRWAEWAQICGVVKQTRIECRRWPGLSERPRIERQEWGPLRLRPLHERLEEHRGRAKRHAVEKARGP